MYVACFYLFKILTMILGAPSNAAEGAPRMHLSQK